MIVKTFLSGRVTLIQGDCLSVMDEFADNRFELVFADLPYDKTILTWDKIIPMELLWPRLDRISTHRSTTIFTSNQPFTSLLVNSRLDLFKYPWYWQKSRPTSFVHAHNMPMRVIEDISVFSRLAMGHSSLLGDNRMDYFPQDLIRVDRILKQNSRTRAPRSNGHRPSNKDEIYQEFSNYPRNLLEFPSVTGAVHPTQKPVELIEYLIRTYTRENDLILDPVSGSGTTAIAAIKAGRRCVCIEKDPDYYKIGVSRCKQELERG